MVFMAKADIILQLHSPKPENLTSLTRCKMHLRGDFVHENYFCPCAILFCFWTLKLLNYFTFVGIRILGQLSEKSNTNKLKKSAVFPTSKLNPSFSDSKEFVPPTIQETDIWVSLHTFEHSSAIADRSSKVLIISACIMIKCIVAVSHLIGQKKQHLLRTTQKQRTNRMER